MSTRHGRSLPEFFSVSRDDVKSDSVSNSTVCPESDIADSEIFRTKNSCLFQKVPKINLGTEYRDLSQDVDSGQSGEYEDVLIGSYLEHGDWSCSRLSTRHRRFLERLQAEEIEIVINQPVGWQRTEVFRTSKSGWDMSEEIEDTSQNLIDEEEKEEYSLDLKPSPSHVGMVLHPKRKKWEDDYAYYLRKPMCIILEQTEDTRGSENPKTKFNQVSMMGYHPNSFPDYWWTERLKLLPQGIPPEPLYSSSIMLPDLTALIELQVLQQGLPLVCLWRIDLVSRKQTLLNVWNNDN